MSSDDRAKAQQRQYYRAPVDFALTATLNDPHETIASHAHDLSGGGIRISMERNLDRGQVVELHLRLPSGTPEIRAYGQVVLSYFEGSSQRYHHGVVFTRISATDQEAIVHYIHEVQRRALKN